MTSKKTVLVVDFEPRRVTATRAWLEQNEYRVIAASSAEELEEILVTSPPTVVLIEPMLPGKDGFELCRAFKRGLYGVVPRVILASRLLRGPRYKSLAKSVGADLFLERPSQDDLVVPALDRLLEMGPEPHPLNLPAPPSITGGSRITGSQPVVTGGVRTTGSQPAAPPRASGPVRTTGGHRVPPLPSSRGGVSGGIPSSGPRLSANPPSASSAPSSLGRPGGTGPRASVPDLDRDVKNDDDLERMIDDAFSDLAGLGGGSTSGSFPAPETQSKMTGTTGSHAAAVAEPPRPAAHVSAPLELEEMEASGPPPVDEALAQRHSGPVTPAREDYSSLAGAMSGLDGSMPAEGTPGGAVSLAEAMTPPAPARTTGASGRVSQPSAPPTGPQPAVKSAGSQPVRVAPAPAPAPSAPTALKVEPVIPVAVAPTKPAAAAVKTPSVAAATEIEAPPAPKKSMLVAAIAGFATILVVAGAAYLYLGGSDDAEGVRPMAPVPGASIQGEGADPLPTEQASADVAANQGAASESAQGESVQGGSAQGGSAQGESAGAPPQRAEATPPTATAVDTAATNARPADRPAQPAAPLAARPEQQAAAPGTPTPRTTPPATNAVAAKPATTTPATIATQPATNAPARIANAAPTATAPATIQPGTAPAATPDIDRLATSPVDVPAAPPASSVASTKPEPVEQPDEPAATVAPKTEAPASIAPLVNANPVRPPELIASTRVAPVYPRRATTQRLDCRVMLDVLIGKDGRVSTVSVLSESMPGYGFGQAAMDAVKQWRYAPASVDGKPVEFRQSVAINFKP